MTEITSDVMAERAKEALALIRERIEQGNNGNVPFAMDKMLGVMEKGLPVLFVMKPALAKQYAEMFFEVLGYVLGYSDTMGETVAKTASTTATSKEESTP